MDFELWDGELGVRIGAYATEDDALAAVRTLCAQSAGSTAPLGLIAHGTRLVAAGERLAQRALAAQPPGVQAPGDYPA